jgi:hypothetical protein
MHTHARLGLAVVVYSLLAMWTIRWKQRDKYSHNALQPQSTGLAKDLRGGSHPARK